VKRVVASVISEKKVADVVSRASVLGLQVDACNVTCSTGSKGCLETT